ncbi:MAG TPA: phosphotransferase [Desulfomicrobiaceae bacterium]|nr:phosphotransferase [Desulfomicrobiaceae bacterium]
MTERIRTFLTSSGWIPAPDRIEFLAAGEYNSNYMVTSGPDRYVFRINHGTQLGLNNQIGYEFNVLCALQQSGVTPKPLFVDPAPDGFEGGVLLMEFLPGRPLRYETDTSRAARIFARIHAQPVSDKILVQANPVRDIAEECLGLLTRYPDHPLQKEYTFLRGYQKTVARLGETAAPLFASEPLCICNTEVNSGNFLIAENAEYLVDWEKAVVTPRYQDLGHFLVPTTTLWKTDFRYAKAQRHVFLETYRAEAGLTIPMEELDFKTALLEKTILLRGLSWCFMAYYEYTRQDRAIQNMDTFETIKRYLKNMGSFFDWVR